MKLDQNSLSKTLDDFNEHILFGKNIPKKAAEEVAIWIASRQGLPGSYCNMFAPTANDFIGTKLFTGEKVASRAATAHILSEEACRALIKIGVNNSMTKNALETATEDMRGRIKDNPSGKYCCGTCSVSFWRHLQAGGLSLQEERIANGMGDLKRNRIGNSKWRFYPFFYTLYALLDIDMKEALEEIRYAAPAMEKSLKSGKTDEPYGKRRAEIFKKLLAKI